MSNIRIHKAGSERTFGHIFQDFEIVERKFRGHPDSLADMVAQRFTQLYILKNWEIFPELKDRAFPNFSADKVTLSGACTTYSNGKIGVLKPVDALLIGKITKSIGNVQLDIDSIFKQAIDEILFKALGTKDFSNYIERHIYAATLTGLDHNPAFYNPKSIKELLKIVTNETYANDTVYVVAYAPLSLTESLSIKIDNVTDSKEFRDNFPEIGSDIKAMIRRRGFDFDITLCLPVFPEKVNSIEDYNSVIKKAGAYLKNKILRYLEKEAERSISINLYINTKDTKDKKYFAVWGTALSKGDIGAVGRGNRPQGFISGTRPSTNEAVSGKNPNHFAGIIYQLVAEDIAFSIYENLHVPNIVYITANNGDKLENPNSVDVILEERTNVPESKIRDFVKKSLSSINQQRLNFIYGNVYNRFMNPRIK